MSKKLFKSTSLVSSMTFISRILGFVRDIIAAQLFGVSAATDAFSVAFKIPNFLRNLFAENCFSQAFVPILSEYKEQRSFSEVRLFMSHVLASLGLILALLSLLGMVYADYVVQIFSPGLDSYRYELAVHMLRITFPYLFWISLTAFAGAALNTYGKFGVQSFTPALLNICLIFTAYQLSPYFKIAIFSQAWGILLAGVVQLLFQLPFLAKTGLLVWPKLSWKDEGVRRVLRLMLPALFGASISQISLLINTIFASFLKIGSITWLYYSERIAYFPLGVFGVALATVSLPQLARQFSSRSETGFQQTLTWGIRCNLLIGIPASLTMMLLSGPLVISLFYYGKLQAHDVWMIQRSVMAYAVGLQAFMLLKLLTSAFYARQDAKTVVKIGVYAIIANMILNSALFMPLAHAGLALATSLSAWFNALVLFFILYQRKIYFFTKDWRNFFIRLLIANLILSVFLVWGAGSSLRWLDWVWWQRFWHLAILGGSAIGIYLLSLKFSGLRKKDFAAV